MALTELDKKALLDIVRKTIEARLTGRSLPELHLSSEVLKEKKGAFVTLKKHSHLGVVSGISRRENRFTRPWEKWLWPLPSMIRAFLR